MISHPVAFSLFSCFLFAVTLFKPRFFSVASIFCVSIFTDIYNAQLVGLSFCEFFFIYFWVLKFRTLLLNSRAIFKIYFFLMLAVGTECLCFVITTVVSGHSFDMNWHFERVCMSVFFCSIYCFLKSLKKRTI